MKVVIAVPSLSRTYGGPSAKAELLSRALGELGVDVDVVGCGNEDWATGLPILARYHSNDIPARVGPLIRAVKRADIVHVLGFREPVSTLSEYFALSARKRLVIEPVGTHRRRLRTFRLKAIFDRSLGTWFLRGASLVIATSRAEMSDLVADGVPAEKIRLRPNGIVVKALNPTLDRASTREHLGIGRDVRLIVSIGRIIGIKGLTQLPHALAALPDDVHIYIGGPDERDGSVTAIRAAAREAGVEDRIILRPTGIWGEEKASVMSVADVFCLPSESESFGTAAAEAAALGIPVVCSTSSGIVEWLEPGSVATFQHGDIVQLRAALTEMLQPDAGNAAKRNAPIIMDRLSWGTIAERQVELYSEALAATAR